MVVGTARHDPETLASERFRERPGVAHDLRRVVAERWLGGLAERDRLGRDDVHERAALEPGEDRLVDRGRVLLAAQDRPARGDHAASCAS